MKLLSLRTIFSPHRSPFSSFLSLQISHFSSSSHPPYSSSSSYSSSFSSRRHDEESKNVRVSVWWDFENCSLPAGSGANVFRVAHSITAAVRANGIKGPIQITAFGDILQLSRFNQEALSSTGINLTHIPNGGKNSADRSLLVDLMYWVSQNPPPAHLFLISGDRDFASILHRLRMNNYNILLASPGNAPGVLCSAASIMWHWHALVRGENLTGKHFNQPPDGPYGSWYGHCKVPLEDPFSLNGQPDCSRFEELSEPASDVKLRPIPKLVMKQICHILKSYPKGISITDLRVELSKTYVSIDKDLYGYKKFSRFLSSMPQILKLQALADGQFVIHGITPKPPEPVESNQGVATVPVSNKGDQDFTITPKLNSEDRSITKAVNGKSSLPPSSEVNVVEPPTNVQEPPPLGKNIEKVINAHVTEGHLPPVEEDSASEVGFLKRIWRKLFTRNDGASGKKSHSIPEECSTSGDISGKTKSVEERVKSISKAGEGRSITKAVNGKSSLPPSSEVNVVEPPTNVQEPPPLGKNIEKVINAHVTVEEDSASEVGFLKRIWRKCFTRNDDASGKKSHNIPEECSTSGDSSGKTKSEEEHVKSISQSTDPVGPASLSLLSNDSALEDKTARGSEVCGDKCSTTSGSFSQIINWCKFWSAGPNSDTSRDQSSERLNQINGHPEKHEIFSVDSFWSEMESFIDTPKGSVLVSQSKTRLQMAQNLQKQGPLILVSQKESDLLHLVDLLISEKKWVEECPSQTLPFKVTRAIGKKNSSLGLSRGSNELSSFFLPTPSQSDLQRPPEHGREKRYRNFPHSEISMPVTDKKPSDRSRSEILNDCQKLVDELFKQYPEGFNMGSVRKHFLERYGYSLDLKKLGYQNLASFLQMMPGVTIESTYVIPSHKVKGSNLETAVPTMKENVTVTNSDSKLSDASRTDDLLGSPWEELGPLADATSNRNVESGLSGKAKEETVRQMHFDYEPSLSDDDFSDSEGETPTGSEWQGKSGMNQEDSALLQVLDSWYSSKEDDTRMDGSENVDGMIDCSRNAVKPSGSSGLGIKSETPSANSRRKQRPQKRYTFVSDSGGDNKDNGGDNKDKLIEGILCSLKASGDSRMQT